MKKHIRQNQLLSQAILYQTSYTLELSGQVGINPKTKVLIDNSIENQTSQTLKNIESILSDVGWDLNNVIKVRIYLTDMENYNAMNKVYSKFFSVNQPARIALAVKELPLNSLIEIECTAIGEQ